MGSSSVAGAIVQFQNGSVPKILFTVSEQISLTEQPTSKKFLSLMMDALDATAQKIHKSGLARLSLRAQKNIFNIKNIHCVFSSPWYISQTKNISVTHDKPFTITPAFLESLVEKEGITTEKGSVKTIPIQTPTKGSVVMEKRVMQVSINGYKIQNPEKYTTNKADVSLFISKTSHDIPAKVESAIRKHFHFHNIQYHSFALVVFNALRDMQNTGRNFLAVDVGGEVTDIAVIKDDIILESVSFPIGKNTLFRTVSEELGMTPDLALSMIKMFGEGRLEKGQSLKVESLLSAFEKTWLKNFHTSLSEISQTMVIPKKVFLTASKNISGLFFNFIKKEKYSDFIPVQDNFVVIQLNEEQLHSVCSYDPKAAQDPFLALEAIFIDKIRGNKHI
jgi:hypothetical protein